MHKHVEYLINADYCRDMADQTHDTGLRIRWLELASRWLKMADKSDAETAQFKMRTGQEVPPTRN